MLRVCCSRRFWRRSRSTSTGIEWNICLQRVDVAKRFCDLAGGFVHPGTLDDRIHEIAFVFDEPGQPEEVFVVRIFGQRFSDQMDLGFEVELGLDTTVDIGDDRGKALALLLFDVELQRLK